MDWSTVAGAAAIQTLIGAAFRFAFERNVEKVDRLEAQVEELKQNDVRGIERSLHTHSANDDARFEAAARSRKGIHERIATIERDYVQATECRQLHEQLTQQLGEFRGAVLDLAAVRTEIKHVAAFVNDVNQRQIGLMQDLARMQGAARADGTG